MSKITKVEPVGDNEILPLGAIVEYRGTGCKELGDDPGMVVEMVIVQHSKCNGSMLYMAATEPLTPPDEKHKLYSRPYLVYRLHAGWFVGNVDRYQFRDTGLRMELQPFDAEKYDY